MALLARTLFQLLRRLVQGLLALAVYVLAALLGPRRPAPKPRPDRALPRLPPGATLPTAGAATTPTLDAAVTGGYVQGGQVTLPAGTTVRLSSDIIIISDGNLVINGRLLAVATRPIGITLVSVNGDVIVAPRARVGFGVRTGAPLNVAVAGCYALARSAAGQNGGNVRILAPSAPSTFRGWCAARQAATAAP